MSFPNDKRSKNLRPPNEYRPSKIIDEPSRGRWGGGGGDTEQAGSSKEATTPIIQQVPIQGNFQRNVVVMLCRAFTMISGGFLFGSGVSHSLWGSIIGTGVGIGAFALTEVTVRRVEG